MNPEEIEEAVSKLSPQPFRATGFLFEFRIIFSSKPTTITRLRARNANRSDIPATIADLFDPETMPERLRRAQKENDEFLERIHIGRRFKNDTERPGKLF